MTRSMAFEVATDPKAERSQALLSWLGSVLNISQVTLIPVAGDASFRRYFRVTHGPQSFIVMDAPPELENVKTFMEVGEVFSRSGIRVPKVHESDPQQGFLLLEDFGDKTFFSVVNADNATDLYQQAMFSLERIQCDISSNNSPLPIYDHILLARELELFREWVMEAWLSLETPVSLWQRIGQILIENALEQPQVCVHRDFHSRNLMCLPSGALGVLDFQDAVIGPVTYDVVSLLKDCYIQWPKQSIEQWREIYRRRLQVRGYDVDARRWQVWFDRMGMQRHLKACGIFVRLWLRDKKPQYLQDIPRVLNMLLESSRHDPQFHDFAVLLSRTVMPEVKRRLSSL